MTVPAITEPHSSVLARACVWVMRLALESLAYGVGIGLGLAVIEHLTK